MVRSAKVISRSNSFSLAVKPFCQSAMLGALIPHLHGTFAALSLPVPLAESTLGASKQKKTTNQKNSGGGIQLC
jgi:hypothetical protein